MQNFEQLVNFEVKRELRRSQTDSVKNLFIY